MSNLQLSTSMEKASNGLSLQQLMILKTELMLRRDALLHSLHATEYHLQTFLEISDVEERFQQREEYRIDLTVQEKEKLQLQCIEQALERIRTGCYGYCELSGEPIGMARLQAQPTATLSRNAQEKWRP
ncbi:TraR/DksA family transcriptional regulator [Chromobacterium vaccinii]|nr:TraR/DksA family transcriptional regulator [Chromobacterium vaccinii]